MKTGVVVIGVSAGGFHALHKVLEPLPSDFSLPIVVLQHQHPEADDYLVLGLVRQDLAQQGVVDITRTHTLDEFSWYPERE